ncbi:MAG: homoserine kinase [Actinomycetota bacterium]|nr:homoserine kinase [Actinomycetota bacterium]
MGVDELLVTVPATSANLGPGFDAMGLALGLYDEVRVTPLREAGLELEIDGEGADEVPRDDSHLVVRTLLITMERLGARPPPGLRLHCTNRIPHGRGLGSSAAATVAGVLAGRALADDGAARRPVEDAIALAAEIEGHPDNVAACLLGGLTIAWREGERVFAVRLDPDPELEAIALVPVQRLATETARGLLPATVPHDDASHNVGRAALLVEALTRRTDLLLPATEDRLHQGYRAAAMPETAALVERLRSAGHAAVVSGAGPGVLVLTSAQTHPDLSLVPANWTTLRLPVAAGGARVEQGRPNG